MPLQGPIILVADAPAADLVEAMGAAGAFPVVDSKWADAPAAFVSVNPAAVVAADRPAPDHESTAHRLCHMVATTLGAMVPMIARTRAGEDHALPIALAVDAALPASRLVGRLQWAMRVRALHAAVLRRIETFSAQDGKLPALPPGDPLDDATVLIAGRGPLYPRLSVALGERVKVLGALSVESAAKHLNTRDIDGIVVGDGFSPRMVEAFLTVLAQEPRFRDIPIAVIDDPAPDFFDVLANIDHVDGDPGRLVARMLPLVRMQAFETRLKRMLASLDAGGLVDPQTGLLTRDSFWRELSRAVAEAAERSMALSVGRIAFDASVDARAARDAARLLTRLIRNIDFACRDDDGALLIAFTQTDLRGAHVIARRIAGALRTAPTSAGRGHAQIAASVTLATLKAGDTLDALSARILGGAMVAAE
jgi:GGDEF domain-containing protein